MNPEMTIHWRAFYTDGSELLQNEDLTYKDIDRDRLSAFGLYRGQQPLVLVDFTPDTNGSGDIGPKRLIWRRRHQQSTNGQHVIVHLVGWQRKVKGRNVQAVCYVNEETGVTVLGGQWMDDVPLAHAIKPLPHEQDLTE